MNQEMIKNNVWHEDTKELFDAILECVKGKWSWIKSKNDGRKLQ